MYVKDTLWLSGVKLCEVGSNIWGCKCLRSGSLNSFSTALLSDFLDEEVFQVEAHVQI